MAYKEFESARALLPRVLSRLSRESGDARHLVPVWEDVVGPVTAQHTRPLSLDGGTLTVEVESPRWQKALVAEQAEILRRLGERLGEAQVAALVYRAVEPK